MTYDNLEFDKIMEAEGDYFDPFNTYLAYTFYLKNNGKETVNVECSLTIQEMHRSVEEAVRFVFIEDGYIRMFKKKDLVPKEYSFVVNKQPDEIIDFSDSVIFRIQIADFEPEEVKQFSIIIYLEGQDDDCNIIFWGPGHHTFSIVEEKN